jgi:hypothetical protein
MSEFLFSVNGKEVVMDLIDPPDQVPSGAKKS